MIKDLYEQYVSTEVITGDAFQDRFEIEEGEIQGITSQDLGELWGANPEIFKLLQVSDDLEGARDALYDYLEKRERWIFDVNNNLHPLEKANVRDCIRVLRSLIAPINEKRTETSTLKILWKLARKENEFGKKPSRGFILEFIHLFKGIVGLSGIYSPTGVCTKEVPAFISMNGREAARIRSSLLDQEGRTIEDRIKKYIFGLDPVTVRSRKFNRERILDYFNATDSDWNNYKWQLEHVIRDADTLSNLVILTEEEREGIQIAANNRIPFGVTPYYVSLMDEDPSRAFDHQIRSQVIPPVRYSTVLKERRAERHLAFDFMGEHDTSPIDLVTRRYPKIAIIKPYNTCAQICIYCQRNWEVRQVLDPDALAPMKKIMEALDWFDEHKTITDILITGGDPFVAENELLGAILDRISEMEQVVRVRFGTRIPVVLPFRITDELVKMLSYYNEPGRREICVVTHFEHPCEVTPEAMEAVQKIKKEGMSIYNQVVYTIENSRRFELVALRRALRLIGVDPYYTFNAKGKEETRVYRVPIARILQERKEEARLMPGIDRTDEPVFNVPRLGKNHLRASQDRRLVAIKPDGRRVYEFHPWEKNILPIPTYNYQDVPIWEYLKELDRRGEDIEEYRNIWYYY
ncbi:KamA family radical SAM protein [bacterium]|nr:KamA family radical SAM protein [bacterium]